MERRAPRYWKHHRRPAKGFKTYSGRRFSGKDRIAVHMIPADWRHGGLVDFTPGNPYYVCGVIWHKQGARLQSSRKVGGRIEGISHYLVPSDTGEILPVSTFWFEAQRLTLGKCRERYSA